MNKSRNLRDWLKVLVLLLDEAAVLVLIVFLLNYFDVQIPLPVTIIIALAAAVFVFIIHIKVIPTFRWKQVTGREGMIGLHGEVIQPLTPSGLITVQGEQWRAESIGGNIEKGSRVEVVAIERLKIKVRLVEV